jgi:hypothetical protein
MEAMLTNNGLTIIINNSYSQIKMYLISMGMTTDDDWLCPAGDKARNVFAYNWFTENCSTKDISNRTIRRLPHLLQIEFYKIKNLYFTMV